MDNPDHVRLICDISELNWVFTDVEGSESFLQRIVIMVAQHMKVDVCSVYLFDDERQELTLRATKGLNPALVGKVRMKLGEGLTGLAVKELRPICERACSKHPNYKYFRDLHEEDMDSFLAVPIIRGINRIGALVVQSQRNRPFLERDITILGAVASQLANILENARVLMRLGQRDKETATPFAQGVPPLIRGKVASEGFAEGNLFVLNRSRSFEELTKKMPGHIGIDAFTIAIEQTFQQLETLQTRVEEKLSDAASLIFTAHLMLLKDSEFVGKMSKLIQNGLSAPQAVAAVGNQVIDAFASKSDPYLREKAEDVRDLLLRILRNLHPQQNSVPQYQGCILAARDLYPSDILTLSIEGVLGVILIAGGATSHLSILARSLQLPLVIADCPGLLGLPMSTKVLLDAEQGNVYVNPDRVVLSSFRVSHKMRADVGRHSPSEPNARTRDGRVIRLLANINLLNDLKTACRVKCEGIGLYRTEFPFIIRSDFPSEEEQYTVYRKLVDGAPVGGVITFRTLDIGGDKVLSYYESLSEKNPFLGMRSIRFSLANKDVFVQQIRAILRAGVGSDLQVMFPMVSSIDEYCTARAIVRECMVDLAKSGIPHHQSPKLGIMVELPSVIDLIDAFAPMSDFFSIGTNDFIQYMLAVDRTNEKVAPLYLPHHPAVLRGIHRVFKAASDAGKPVSVCGDMAHQEIYLSFLIGIGVRALSLDPAYVPKVRSAISRIDTAEAREFAAKLVASTRISEIEETLKSYGPRS